MAGSESPPLARIRQRRRAHPVPPHTHDRGDHRHGPAVWRPDTCPPILRPSSGTHRRRVLPHPHHRLAVSVRDRRRTPRPRQARRVLLTPPAAGRSVRWAHGLARPSASSLAALSSSLVRTPAAPSTDDSVRQHAARHPNAATTVSTDAQRHERSGARSAAHGAENRSPLTTLSPVGMSSRSATAERPRTASSPSAAGATTGGDGQVRDRVGGDPLTQRGVAPRGRWLESRAERGFAIGGCI